MRSRSSTSRRVSAFVSSLELSTQLDEAARDAAGDRAGRQLEPVADRPVALVTAEEPVKEVRARFAQAVERPAHRDRKVELGKGLVHLAWLDVFRRLDACCLPKPVNAQVARQLREP